MKAGFLFISLLFLISDISTAQEKTVSLITAGKGKTQDEARAKALTTASEQAFATFVSEASDILKDPLMADEIITVSNGYILEVEKLAELMLPNGEVFSVFKTQIPIGKLISFAEKNGVVVEQKGGLFSYNINQQILNDKNEQLMLSTLRTLLDEHYKKLFDYKVAVGSPVADGSNKRWKINLKIAITPLQSASEISAFLYYMLNAISLPEKEIESYLNVDKSIYPVSILLDRDNFSHLFFRTEQSVKLIDEMVTSILWNALNFKISSGFDEIELDRGGKDQFYYPLKKAFLADGDYTYTYALSGSGNGTPAKGTEKFFEKNGFLEQNFPFVVKLKDKMYGIKKTERYWRDPQYYTIELFTANPGYILSLDRLKAGVKLIDVEINDLRSLEELNKIQDYKPISPDVVAQNSKARADLIQGGWISVDDPTEGFIFVKNQMKDIYYNGEEWMLRSEDKFALGATCASQFSYLEDVDEDAEVKEKPKDKGDQYLTQLNSYTCWYIVSLSESFLTLKESESDQIIKFKKMTATQVPKTLKSSVED